MIHWNADPILVHLGPLKIRWYSMMFLIGFTAGYHIVKGMFLKQKKPIETLESLLVHLVLGTMIGARLGHCLFYDPEYYLSRPLEILKVWEGGLASHGGVLGVVTALWLFCRKNPSIPLFWLMDRVAVPVALVGSLIRLGNLMNSEILGRPTDVPWAFIFERVDRVPRHPAQIYESLSYLFVFLVTWALYRRNPLRPPGLLLGLTVGLVFLFRIFWEFFKENQEPFEAGMMLNMGQLLSIPFVIVGGVLVIRALRSQPRTG